MFDTENQDQQIVQAAEQINEQQEQQVEAAQEAPKQESPAERNFRALAEKARRLEKERDEAIKALQSHQSPSLLPQEQQSEEEVADFMLGNDDIAEGKHLNSLTKQIKSLKKELQQYKQTSAAMTEEAMIKIKYPDIDKVVTSDNIAILRQLDPDFAEMMDTSSSFKAKAISAYKKIKESGIYQEDTYGNDKAVAMKNAAKPRPASSVSPQQGEGPLSRANAFANGLTEDLKKELLKEMNEAMKRR